MQAQRAAARAGKPFVSSPRGMLSAEALAISGLKKRLMWALRQGAALRATTAFHATSEQELVEIRALSLRAPVAVIPNGIDVGAERTAPDAAGGQKTVLALGRIHPKKGLVGLL
ncbi:glycosyltransferase, partial [Mycobacterium tuberculosis]